ncbi:hypothetical protein GALMADRAFT_900021 [Galerina marginata CBS 339.88]|uniref:Uncharacterized protein n=1 Tax=Galerina marginata (strain CBS 339.88) TaxID=685588 RepID=A0A067SQQ1_GALM3|nr:hypothetical protein GALMADRAFT_900021 [Galerina marginata CBS 339.88]
MKGYSCQQMRCKAFYSLCDCCRTRWQATQAHVRLGLCWSPHVRGSSCRRMRFDISRCLRRRQCTCWQATRARMNLVLLLEPSSERLQLPPDVVGHLSHALSASACAGRCVLTPLAAFVGVGAPAFKGLQLPTATSCRFCRCQRVLAP